MERTRSKATEEMRKAIAPVAEEITDRDLPTMDEATALVYLAAIGNKVKPPANYPEPKTRLERTALIARDAYLMGVAAGLTAVLTDRYPIDERIAVAMAQQAAAGKSDT